MQQTNIPMETLRLLLLKLYSFHLYIFTLKCTKNTFEFSMKEEKQTLEISARAQMETLVKCL